MKILDATLRDGGFVNDFGGTWNLQENTMISCLNLRSTILN